MDDDLKLDIDELESAIQYYQLISENLEQIISLLKHLKTEFTNDNNGQTALKIEAIIDQFRAEVKTCNELTAELQTCLNQYLELVADVLQPGSSGEVVVDLAYVNWLKTDLEQSFSANQVNQRIIAKFNWGIESCTDEIFELRRKREGMGEALSGADELVMNKQIEVIKANQQLLEQLSAKLKKDLNFEREIDEINELTAKLQNFWDDQSAISVDECADLLARLQGYNLESSIYGLNATITTVIKSQAIDKLIDNLDEKAKKEILKKITKLRLTGMYDNFWTNVNKQIELMGLDNFLSDPKRIQWLADNPQVKVGEFSSNLIPEQLRLLTEELPYALFDEKPDGVVVTNYEFYQSLINKNYNTLYHKQVKNILGKTQIFTTSVDRFFASNMQFTEVLNPKTKSAWLINEDGFQAAVIDVNGEIIITYPGSQETKSDWIENDILPNLTHTLPRQYRRASELAAEVKAAYPDKNIILCGHSLAGGSVEYAGSQNDLNSFYIDPAPVVINPPNRNYNKGVGVIPGGKSDGVLNQIETDKQGYNKTDTDIDILDYATMFSPVLSKISNFSQAHDRPAQNETAILNDTNERNDIENNIYPGIQDHYTGYGGDHLLGTIDDDYQYAYVPITK